MLKRFKEILNGIRESFNRFPVTITTSTLLAIMIIFLLEKEADLSAVWITNLQRVIMIIALGIPLSLCIKLLHEKQGKIGRVHMTFSWLLGIGFLLVYYFLLLKDLESITIMRYIGLSLFLYLAFAYIPWLGRDGGFELYIIRILYSFFLTIIYSQVLYMGISAILLAMDQLLEIQIPGKIYYYAFIMVAGIFAPASFLSRIPDGNHSFDESEYPRALKMLLLYIVIPLASIYLIILYIYFLKIIISRSWPRGLVSHLVLWYSLINVLVIFLINPITRDNKLANRFTQWFPVMNIPIMIMMFMSIATRIRIYGITEKRYLVLLMGIWVFCIMMFIRMRKNLQNIVIPITLSIIALNAVFGPLSAFAVSKRSQNNRLGLILNRNNMLEDNSIVKAPDNMFTDDKMEVSMVIKYFDRYHSLKDIKYLDDNFEIGDMESIFGFPYTEKEITDEYFNIFMENRGGFFEVAEYDYLLEGYYMMNGVTLVDDIVASYNIENNRFTIKDSGLIYDVNLKEVALDIISKHRHNISASGNQNILNVDEMTFMDENNKVKIKFIINSISGEKKDQTNKYRTLDIDYHVLIKIK